MTKKAITGHNASTIEKHKKVPTKCQWKKAENHNNRINEGKKTKKWSKNPINVILMIHNTDL